MHHGDLTGLTDDDHSIYVYKTPATTARNIVQSSAADAIPFTLRAHASQSVDLFVIENSAGVDYAAVNSTGFWGIGVAPSTTKKVYISSTFDNSVNQTGLAIEAYASAAGTTKALYGLTFTVQSTNASGDVFSILGFYGSATAVSTGTGTTTNVTGGQMQAVQNSANAVTGMVGAYVVCQQNADMGNVDLIRGILMQNTVNSTLAGTYGNVYGTYYDLDVGAAGNITGTYWGIYVRNPDVTAGGAIGNVVGIEVGDINDGVTLNIALRTNAGLVILNEGGDAASDFRWESDTEANMLFGDANGDTNGSLCIGGTTNGVKVIKGGDLSFLGSAGFYPRRISQNAEPANGTGATEIDAGELMIWHDADAVETWILYNDAVSGVVGIKLA